MGADKCCCDRRYRLANCFPEDDPEMLECNDSMAIDTKCWLTRSDAGESDAGEGGRRRLPQASPKKIAKRTQSLSSVIGDDAMNYSSDLGLFEGRAESGESDGCPDNINVYIV